MNLLVARTRDRFRGRRKTQSTSKHPPGISHTVCLFFPQCTAKQTPMGMRNRSGHHSKATGACSTGGGGALTGMSAADAIDVNANKHAKLIAIMRRMVGPSYVDLIIQLRTCRASVLCRVSHTKTQICTGVTFRQQDASLSFETRTKAQAEVPKKTMFSMA